MDFEGRLVVLDTTKEENRGLDISALSDVGDDLRVTAGNSSVGGVNISPSDFGELTSAAPNAVAQSVIGGAYESGDTLLQGFIGYMDNYGDVRTIQKPFMSTSSGVPVNFSQFDRTYVNLVQEDTTINQNVAQTSRTNNLVPFQFGTSLRLNPNYDSKRDVVRTQISLTQTLRAGTQTINQVVSDGEGTQVIDTDIPLDRRITYQGETIMEDGALVVIGGQTIKDYRSNESGITGLKDSAAGGLFGTSDTTNKESTYYFLLSMKIRYPDE